MTQSVLPILTVTSIRRGGPDNRAVRAELEYTRAVRHPPARVHDYPGWFPELKAGDPVEVVETERGAALDVGVQLADPQFLEKFLSPGAPSAFEGLCRMAKGLDANPVFLRGGTLSHLLAFGITPAEALVFCLNHGAKSAALASSDSRQNVVESLVDVARACVRLTRGLRRLQDVRIPWSLGPEVPESEDPVSAVLSRTGLTRSRARKMVFAEKLGNTNPVTHLPPLPPKFAAKLAKDLEAAALILRDCAELLKRARKRPREFTKDDFCRAWYGFANERAGGPLYAQGASLFAVTFGLPKPNAASFKTLCARARKRLTA